MVLARLTDARIHKKLTWVINLLEWVYVDTLIDTERGIQEQKIHRYDLMKEDR